MTETSTATTFRKNSKFSISDYFEMFLVQFNKIKLNTKQQLNVPKETLTVRIVNNLLLAKKKSREQNS